MGGKGGTVLLKLVGKRARRGAGGWGKERVVRVHFRSLQRVGAVEDGVGVFGVTGSRGPRA